LVRIFPIDDPSRVAEVRRAAAALSHDEDLDETLAGNIALISTEICTNMLKHATHGEVFLSTLSDRTAPGIEVLAIDRGPGMTDVTRCLTDGYSSTNTSGTGLGAIARLSQEFDIYSEAGKGTVLVAQVRRESRVKTSAGAVIKPIAGEEIAGDAWAFREWEGGLTLIVADGLGHGPMAARASSEAISAFRRSSESSPVAVLNGVHGSLRGTRGAAVAIAYVNPAERMVKYAGIGNITGVIIRAGKPLTMVSHNGTAGFLVPRLQEFSYALPDEALIVMHSDGLRTNWDLDSYPGLRRRHPSVIAGVLYRDALRNRDDVCVIAAKIPKVL
jgi:anti-sigma regulatory factor (Ser/Thr protein kinase)